MSLLRKINPFWLGAGAFLFVFNANEIIARHTAQVPSWLGGTPVYIAAIFGAVLGVAVMLLLGIRPEVES